MIPFPSKAPSKERRTGLLQSVAKLLASYSYPVWKEFQAFQESLQHHLEAGFEIVVGG